MMQRGDGKSGSEVKLSCAYMLLDDGFAKMTEALARIDENAAWGMLAAINGRITRMLREESAKLVAKGYPPDELKWVSDHLSKTILAAGQAIEAQRVTPNPPTPAGTPEHDSLAFARVVREAHRANSTIA